MKKQFYSLYNTKNRMTKKNILIASIIALCAAYYFYTNKPATKIIPVTNNTLIVGISPDFPPYAQIDLETGAIVGLEIDVVTEVARRLDKKLEIKDMPFNSLIIELMSGHVDIVAAGMTPTEERKKTVLFSHPYVDNDENIVVTKKSNAAITSIEDLFGKSVAVNIGYTADTYLSKYPQINLVRLKSPSDGFMALQANSVDAFTIAESIVNKFLDTQSQDHDYQFFILPASADACALAYKKNNTKLQEEIDPVIDTMIEDGTMHIIKKKWGFE